MDSERRVSAGTVVDFLTKGAKPSLNNKFDALVVAIHAIMQLHGFVLIGAGDTMAEDGQLPKCWNESDSYALRYTHPMAQKTAMFLLKCLPLGDHLLVSAMDTEKSQPNTIELNTSDFVPGNNFSNISSSMYRGLDALIATIKSKLIFAIVPNASAGGQTDGAQPRGPQHDDPLRIGPPRQPRPPYGGGVDPYVPPFAGQPGYGPGPFNPLGDFRIGRDDLFPGGSGAPGGGMLFGPNHPGFGPGANDPYAPRGQYPPGYGNGSPQRPPGARFDPFGPPIAPDAANEPDPDILFPPRAGPPQGRGGGGGVGGGDGYGNMFM